MSTAVIAPADCKELSTWQVLGHSSVQTSITGTTTETTFATVAVPAGAMGPNGRLRIWTMWTAINNANAKQARVRFGGTEIFRAGITTLLGVSAMTIIRNRNAQNSQVGYPPVNVFGFGPGNAALLTMALDTSIAQNLTFTGQLVVAGDNLAIESYLVELCYGA